MIVTVSHPAVVVHVPARARAERADLALVSTPVELHTLALSEMRPVPLPLTDETGSSEAYLAEGALWRPVDPTTGIDAGRLARWLSDPAARETVLDAAFAGTPLLARACHPLRSVRGPGLRGRPVDPGDSRSVSRDDRARASREVEAYLDAHVRLVGGKPFRRAFPLVVYDPGFIAGRPPRLDVSDRPVLERLPVAAASPGNLGSLVAFADGKPWPSEDRAMRAWLDAGYGEALEGADHRRAADGLAGLARVLLQVRREGHPRPGAIAEADRILHAVELDAATGRAGLDDPGEALRAMARVFEALVPTGRVLPWEPASFQLSALRSHYLPTLPAPALDPRDDAALRAI